MRMSKPVIGTATAAGVLLGATVALIHFLRPGKLRLGGGRVAAGGALSRLRRSGGKRTPDSAPQRNRSESHANDTRPYEERTVRELYELATQRKISGRSAMNKADLIAALRTGEKTAH